MADRVVLVVEDEASIREMIQLAVEDFLGLPTMAAEDGTEALRLVEERPPGVILLDIALPGTDGLGIARMLRANPLTRRIPIVAVTASASRAEVLAAGCDDYLAKPFELDALLSKVQRYLPVHAQVTAPALERPHAQ